MCVCVCVCARARVLLKDHMDVCKAYVLQISINLVTIAKLVLLLSPRDTVAGPGDHWS